MQAEGPPEKERNVKKSRHKSQICPHCHFTAATSKTLRVHIIRKHTMRFKHNCTFCPKGFIKPLELQRHIQRQHSNETIDNVKKEITSDCDISNDLSHSAVGGHKKLSKKFSCSECPYSSNRKTHLKTHLLPHTRKRPFQCELCDKAFGDKGHLNIHLLFHTGERPYVCDTCGRGFYERCRLRRHEVTSKGKCRPLKQTQSKKKYSCSECPYSTDCNQHFKRHGLSHSGERPHQCELCDKAFALKQNLISHLRCHTGERPYVCNTCGKGYRRKFDLRAHEGRHSEETPYP